MTKKEKINILNGLLINLDILTHETITIGDFFPNFKNEALLYFEIFFTKDSRLFCDLDRKIKSIYDSIYYVKNTRLTLNDRKDLDDMRLELKGIIKAAIKKIDLDGEDWRIWSNPFWRVYQLCGFTWKVLKKYKVYSVFVAVLTILTFLALSLSTIKHNIILILRLLHIIK